MHTGATQHWVPRLLREHPALLVSVFYVGASMIGMLFSWAYLRHFGINVFNYAQIGDFLLASLKEPMTWGLVFLAVLLVTVDNYISYRWHQRAKSRWTRWYGSPRYRAINYLIGVVIVVLFIQGFADSKARRSIAGKGKLVQIALADAPDKRPALLLGTTSQFVFLYDVDSARVDVLPNENIQSISFFAPR